MYDLLKNDFPADLMGRLVHLLSSDDPDQHFLILNAARKALATGGPKRITYTLPPVVMQTFQLAKRFYARRNQVLKISMQ